MKITWSEAIEKTKQWETRYPWIERFRLTYYFDQQRDWKGKLRMRIVYLLQRNQLQLTILLSLLRPKKKFSKADYLFILTSNPAYLNCLIPILATLKSQGKSIRIFTPNWERNKVVKRLQKEGLEDIELFTESDWGGQGIFKWLYASFSSSFAALWFLINSNTRFIQRNSFFQFAFLEKYFGNAVEETLEAHQHLIAAADHWMWESLFFHQAKNHPVNSLVVQHGLIADFCVPLLCKQYAVWGNYDQELMLQRGVAAESILIAGAPHFDQFAKLYAAQSELQAKKYITFFAQPYFKYPYLGEGKYALTLDWLNQLQQEVQRLGKELQIRLHPLDIAQDYSSLLGSIKIAKGSLADTIQESCLALTIDSAVVFECGMAQLPVIQLSNNFDRFMDMSTHYTRKASSESELKKLVEGLLGEKSTFLNEQKRQQEGLSYYLANPGQAAIKIIQYCEEK